MMTGVTNDHAEHSGAAGHGRWVHRPSILQQFGRIRSELRAFGDFMATVDDQLTRLEGDVTNYVNLMRGKVDSLTAQITQLQGQVSTAATDQMTADAQAISDHLDALEAALAQDNPPTDGGGGTTPTDGGDGGTPVDGGGNPPSARRR